MPSHVAGQPPPKPGQATVAAQPWKRLFCIAAKRCKAVPPPAEACKPMSFFPRVHWLDCTALELACSPLGWAPDVEGAEHPQINCGANSTLAPMELALLTPTFPPASKHLHTKLLKKPERNVEQLGRPRAGESSFGQAQWHWFSPRELLPVPGSPPPQRRSGVSSQGHLQSLGKHRINFRQGEAARPA